MRARFFPIVVVFVACAVVVGACSTGDGSTGAGTSPAGRMGLSVDDGTSSTVVEPDGGDGVPSATVGGLEVSGGSSTTSAPATTAPTTTVPALTAAQEAESAAASAALWMLFDRYVDADPRDWLQDAGAYDAAVAEFESSITFTRLTFEVRYTEFPDGAACGAAGVPAGCVRLVTDIYANGAVAYRAFPVVAFSAGDRHLVARSSFCAVVEPGGISC